MNSKTILSFLWRFILLYLLADPGFLGLPHLWLIRMICCFLLAVTWKE